MSNVFFATLSKTFHVGLAVALSVLVNTRCHSEDANIHRGIDDPFPSDCEMLSDQELKIADIIYETAKIEEFRSESLPALQKYLQNNFKKSYAWWRWKMGKLQNEKNMQSDFKLQFMAISVLEQEVSFEKAGNIKTLFTWYSLKDGSRVLHGLFVSTTEDSYTGYAGSFWHGLRHGRWIQWIGYDRNREVYTDGYWRNGKPWDGTLEVMINGDCTREEFKEGKRKTKDGYKVFDYKPQVIVLSPNRNPDQSSEGKKTQQDNSKEDAAPSMNKNPAVSKNSSDP